MKTIGIILWAAISLATGAHAQVTNCGSWNNFDEHGVVLVDYGGEIGVQYNATPISQIGRACLLRYKLFKLPEDWRTAMAQINWLKDNTVPLTEEGSVYVHNFPWTMGLKPGWTSGSSQTNAILAMTEYYRQSHDVSILPVIRKIKNGMMVPVSKGGTMAISTEGGVWIEEFPTEPPSLVLGSFVGSIIALHEVMELFPDDVETRKDFEATFGSLKTSLKFYDSGNWFYIYRWPGLVGPALADEGYGKAIPRALLELAEITKDPFILETSLRWRSFYEDVNVQLRGNVVLDDHETYRTIMGVPKQELIDVIAGNVKIIGVSPDPYVGSGADKLFDNDLNTYLSLDPGPARLQLQLDKPEFVNTMRISLYNVGLYPMDLKIKIRAEGEKELQSIPFVREGTRRDIYYHFDSVRAEEIEVSATRFSQQDRLVVSELALGTMNWNDRKKPTYCSHTTSPVELDTTEFRVQIVAPLESAKQVYVIYRHAPDSASIENSPWQWDI